MHGLLQTGTQTGTIWKMEFKKGAKIIASLFIPVKSKEVNVDYKDLQIRTMSDYFRNKSHLLDVFGVLCTDLCIQHKVTTTLSHLLTLDLRIG